MDTRVEPTDVIYWIRSVMKRKPKEDGPCKFLTKGVRQRMPTHFGCVGMMVSIEETIAKHIK